MTNTNRVYGWVSILTIAVTAGICLPATKLDFLASFSPAQQMTIRALTVTVCTLIIGGKMSLIADKYAKMSMFVMPIATGGLFYSVRELGPGLALIMLSLTPIVNFVFGAIYLKRKATATQWICAAVAILGVFLAVNKATFNLLGFVYSIIAIIGAAAIFEVISLSKSHAYAKCLYSSVGVVSLGIICSFTLGESWSILTKSNDSHLVFAWALVGGFIYWMANMIAFKNLPVNVASVAVQIETPAVIVGGMYMIGDKIGATQWLGVIITLIACSLIMFFEKPRPNS